MLNLIYCRSINGVIGNNNTIPWHLKEDLQRFRSLTEGCSVIMGRKTYESLGKPLKKRQNIVLTRKGGIGIPGQEEFGNGIARTKEEALGLTMADIKNTFVIGGVPIYKMFQYECKYIYETIIMKHYNGDAHFCVDYDGLRLANSSVNCDEKEKVYYQFNFWIRNNFL